MASTLMIGLEIDLAIKCYVFHIMILKGRFLCYLNKYV